MLGSSGTRHRGLLAGAAASLCAGLLAPASVLTAMALDVPRGAKGTEPLCTVSVASQERSSLWAPPLDRIVNVRIADGTLREAVDHVASVAKLELSYSVDLLPSTRRVCLTLTRVPVGAVLETLLAGTTLRAIVLGSTQVVLAPSRATATTATDSAPTRRASVLDRVVVTGSPDGAPQRGSPFALDVVDGAMLAQHGVGTLAEALDLSVPGVWTWSATAGSVNARYGSIRGASSFGVSAPKVYLDGIEVANPLLVTQLDPARVARVEVIRGPQGAALYGADAISGVVNILTRHDGTPDGGRQFQLTSNAGVAATAYATRNPLVQEHSLAFRQGSSSRSAGLGLTVGTVGAYVPGASERRLLADADARMARNRAVFTGTARFSLQRANASAGLMLGNDVLGAFSSSGGALSALGVRRDVGSSHPPDTTRPYFPPDSQQHAVAGDSAVGQQVAQYTLGGSVAVMPSLHWTHTFIAGVDGYRLRGFSSAASPGPTTLSTAASSGNAQGAADRATIRLRTVGRFDVAPTTLLTVTLAAEQAMTHEVLTTGASVNGGYTNLATAQGGPALTRPGTGSGQTRTTYDNSGLSAQAMVAIRDRWFASAGARAERTTGATPNAQQSLLPMLGMAYVRDIGSTVIKLRSAYGTGIRPARTLLRNASWMGAGQQSRLSFLDAEEQSGVEMGADVLIGSRIGLHLTRFDQRASGLIQPVSGVVTAITNNGRVTRAMSYTLQNVGAITNRGWELEGTTRLKGVSLAGTVSLVDSRVARMAPGYLGELRVGDRMLDVPANTVSLAAGWVRGRVSLTSSVIRAGNWIGYDRAQIGEVLASSESLQSVEGANLRNYWIPYRGVTRWRAGVTYRLRDDLSLVTSGENLLNVQTGAPDNATVIAGRTVMFGVRTMF